MKQVISDVEVVTPKRAQDLLDSSVFDRQRRISEKRVDYLADEMKTGRFVPAIQIYFGQLPNGRMLLLNGQHTLKAVARSETSQPLTISICPVDDEDDAGRLYAVFDTHRARSWRDSILAVKGEVAEELFKRAIPAIKIINSGFDYVKASHNPNYSRLSAIEAASEFENELGMYREGMTGASQQMRGWLFRAAIMAVFLYLFRHQPSTTAEFMARIVADEGLQKGMPERALLQWLREPRNQSHNLQITRRLNSCAVACAWNAYFCEEQIGVIQPSRMVDFYLVATPISKSSSKTAPRYRTAAAFQNDRAGT